MPPTEHCFHASDSVLLPCARLQECKIADPNLFFAMSFNKLCTSVKPDNIILMDNGVLPFKVEPVASDHVMCKVMCRPGEVCLCDPRHLGGAHRIR